MKTKIIMSFKVFCAVLTVLLIATPSGLEARKKTAKGIVFEDTNRNNVLDKGEKGIPGVVVSNQCDVVQTDNKGHFRLPLGKEAVIFISKPAGYNVPVDENNLPRFYYIHRPKGSPSGLKYKGIAPTGKRPRFLHFPLIKGKLEQNFNVVIMGDPQTRTPQELDFYRDEVVAGLMGTTARFYLALGDIMYNDLSLFDKMNRLVGQMGIPIYHVQGNHDMNFHAPDYTYEGETFKKFYGPDYYSFNYGKVHFVVLNTVKYKGWNKKENKKGDYTGYIHEKQLTWLKNDLSFVPADHLIVFSMHIPVDSEVFREEATIVMNRGAFFKILEKREHLLALAGHMHFVEYQEFTKRNGWHGNAVFPSLTAGAACGTWWHGPPDTRGIPFGMCSDGAPNGYFIFTFKGNRFHYRFHPCSPNPHSQMRINSPKGTLSLQDLKDRQITINVNVFAGTLRTLVSYELDDGPETVMERKMMKDPFFAKLVTEYKDSYLEWMEPTISTHIWEAPLPKGLKPGIHRLKITVKDRQGNVFTAYRLFEIASPASGVTTCR